MGFFARLSKMLESVRAQLTGLHEQVEDRPVWRYAPQLAMGLVLIIITTLIFPYESGVEFSSLKEGDVYVGDEVIAPFTFFINKSEEEYQRDLKAAAEKVPPVFTRVDSLEEQAVRELNRFFDEVDKIRASVLSDSAKLNRLLDLLHDRGIIIQDEIAPLLLARQQKGSAAADGKNARFNYQDFKANIIRIFNDLYSFAILNLPADEIPDYATRISLVTNSGETIEPLDNYFPRDAVQEEYLEKLRNSFPDQPQAVKMGYEIVRRFLKPNLIYDESETKRRIEEAQSKVPLAKGTVLAKERIIDTHERITRDKLEKLRSLAEAKAERASREGGFKLVLPYVGRMLLVALALSFTVLFLYVSRREVLESVKRTTMIFVIFLLILAATFVVNQLNLSPYLIPVAIASMLLTIFFDTRTAFVGTVTLSVLIGALRSNEFGIMFVTLFVGAISTFSVREIQARSWILKGLISIALAYIVSISAVEFMRYTNFMTIAQHWMDGTVNGLFSPILTYGLMIMFEVVFGVSTDSTLLELSDLNKPLLRQLVIRAPGTYHHSLLVGNLAEAAAETIAANPLLARVGAYYHDIGKMDMPEYFVENQKGGRNPHERLKPNMSCLILINHIKRGLEIADQYNLPKEIRDFIPEHHGTNLITFFYKKALSESEDSELNEADFRYPGPKPHTKETGIVMLADAVEAASRTLNDPSVSRVRSMVTSIIRERLEGGELDDCPLTLRDLKQINDSFVKILTGIFHGRISYPDQDRRFFRKQKKSPREKPVETAN